MSDHTIHQDGRLGTDGGLGPVRDHLYRLMPEGSRGRRMVGWGVVAWTGIGLAILLWVAWKGLERVGGVFPYLVMAWMVVLVLNPAVKALVRRGMPRRGAATVVFVMAMVLSALVLDLLIPALAHQGQSLVRDSPLLVKKGGSLFDPLARSSNPILRNAGSSASKWIQDHAGNVQSYLRTVTDAGLKLAHAGLVLLLGGFLSYLLLLSLPDTARGFAALIPPSSHEKVSPPLAEARRIVAGYVRARLIVSAVVGTFATFGLWAVHMPFWLLLGIIVGVSNLVPMLGTWIGAVPVTLVSLLTKPPSFLIVVGIVVTLAHMIDGYVLSPIVLKETTKLHPVVILLAVLVGADLLGFWGILAAIPVAGVIQWMLREWLLPRAGTEPLEPTPPGDRAVGVPG